MRVIECNNQEAAIVLQDSGEIAKVLMAFLLYNASLSDRSKGIPASVVERLEEAFGE